MKYLGCEQNYGGNFTNRIQKMEKRLSDPEAVIEEMDT